MSKKKNRPKAKVASKPVEVEVSTTRPAEEAAPPPPTTEQRVPRAPKLSRSQIAAERIEDEYAYITGDLRRVFILAAVMFALLIVLNIVLSRVGM